RVIADLGTHLVLMGRVAEAELHALEALKMHPDSPDDHVLMGRIRLRQRRMIEAQEHALTALLSNASYAPGLELLCWIRLQANFRGGGWWRFAVWLGRPRIDKSSLVVFAVVAALYAPAFALFMADRVLLGWLAIAAVVLCVGALWLSKKLF